MSNNFDACLKYVLRDEGGNDDDPNDHGGRTSRGITQREYDAWRRLNGKSTSDVWKATDTEIKCIYRDQYWKPYCDNLPSGLDYLFFDISVNAGRQRAVITFQKALGIKADGMMGQVTLESIQNHSDPEQLIHDISDVRRNWYRHLAQFPIYGKGWLNRVDHAEAGAIGLAMNDKTLDKKVAPSAKANNQQPDSTTISPEASGGTVIAAGGLDALLKSFTVMLEPYKETIHYVSYALLGIAVVSIIYASWGYYKRSKVQAAM